MSANQARNNEIIRRRKAGEWPRAIARDMGLSHNVVIGVCNRAGLCDFDAGRAMNLPAINQVRGERAHCAKLTADQIAAIRARYVYRSRVNGSPALAERYGVTQQTIIAIVTGQTWRHLLSEAA